MEIKEALRLLDELNIMTLYDGDSLYRSEFAEPLKMAISALKKQDGKTAKKEPRQVLDYCYYCPTCNKYFGGTFDGEWITGKPYYHCPECGQKIDWSE